MRVLYFGTYHPNYGRNRVTIKGLRDNGVDVVFCNGGVSGGVKKFLRLVWQYLSLPHRSFDVILVAWPAQEVMLVAGVLFLYQRIWHKTPVIVDMLTSHYDGYILDRKKYGLNSYHASWYRWLDRTAVKLADCAIVESHSTGQFFAEELNVPAHKLLTMFIGTDDGVMKQTPTTPKDTDEFLVHFHGNFNPHQGIESIIKAANLLKEENISFQIIGQGQDYSYYRKMADDFGLANIKWINSVPYEHLPDFINKADICLGPMGGTDHFDRCAPNKIYEYMACGRPIIVGRSKSLQRIAVDGTNMLLVKPADENDLAQKIILLKNNKALRDELGENARADFLRFYTPKKLIAHFFEDLRKRQLLATTEIEDTTILLTGATGFIGSRLSKMLSEQGYKVTNYIGDINDLPNMENYFKTADIVIHLAAKNDEVREGREKDDFITVNVLGTQQVVDLCLKYNCKLLFFSSVVAIHPKNIYGLSKTFGEQLIQLYGAQYGLKAIILRPYGIYDEEGLRRSGKHVNHSRGRNYPLTYLLRDVERIIVDDKFSSKIRIYTTVLFWEHRVLYWPRKVLDKFKRII
jgi:glycosyltransferase involved in cell wall biosynthesis